MAAGRFWKLPKGVGRVVGGKCARDGVLSVFRCFRLWLPVFVGVSGGFGGWEPS